MPKNEGGSTLVVALIGTVAILAVAGVAVLTIQSGHMSQRYTRCNRVAQYYAEAAAASCSTWLSGLCQSTTGFNLILAPGNSDMPTSFLPAPINGRCHVRDNNDDTDVNSDMDNIVVADAYGIGCDGAQAMVSVALQATSCTGTITGCSGASEARFCDTSGPGSGASVSDSTIDTTAVEITDLRL